MKNAYIFPGQGSQYPGMAKDLYESNAVAREMFEKANDILGFRITDIMFEGTAEELKQTKVTQPAIFLHSVVLARCLPEFRPDMVAGHSLGEFSALVAAGALDFEEGLRLISIRAQAMQKSCEAVPGSMAAVLAMPAEKVEEICASCEGIVVAANYNCEGQIVISGEVSAVNEACTRLRRQGPGEPCSFRSAEPSIPLLWNQLVQSLQKALKKRHSILPYALYIKMLQRVLQLMRRKLKPIF